MDCLEVLQYVKNSNSIVDHFNTILYVPSKSLEKEVGFEVGSSFSDKSPDELVKSMINHRNDSGNIPNIHKTTFQGIQSLDVNDDSAIGVLSAVNDFQLGQNAHIPMLDFKCAVSDYNTDLIKAFIRKIDVKGFLLDSGQSYHFYGETLMNESEWKNFNYTALLFSPFIDQRYIAHRLLSGFSVLRIGVSRLKPKLPTLIKRL